MFKIVVVSVLGIVAVVVLSAALCAGIGFNRDMRAARARISAGSVIDTAAGPVEYAESGSGAPAAGHPRCGRRL